MSTEPTIYIVIPVHNRLEATRECLDSLRAQTYQDFRTILIDDGSTDGTADYVQQHYPKVTVLHGDGTLWWTGATNLGLRHVLEHCQPNDYILTLNNDTVLPATYLETISSLAKQAPNALIGSIARDHNRPALVVDEGVDIDWFSAKFKNITGRSTKEPNSFYFVSTLSGRGTLIPTGVFQKIGLYDQKRFPHYAADYDLSLRASNAGYNLALHPSCYLYSKTNLTGISNTYNKMSFAAWLQSFSSLRSPNNLKIRFRFGLRHAPFLYCPTFIVCDFIRVTLGTLRNQIRNLGQRKVIGPKS